MSILIVIEVFLKATHFDGQNWQPLVVQEIPNLKESSSRMAKPFMTDLNESIRPGREE